MTRILNDHSQSWLLTKVFGDFFDFNNIIKEWGYELELPPKKAFGRTDRTFMAERQKGLQVSSIIPQMIFQSIDFRIILICLYNDMNYVILYSFNNFSILIIIKPIILVFRSGMHHFDSISIHSLLESAAQYVSMFTRSTNNTYQVVESLPDLGRLFVHSRSHLSLVRW